MSELVISGCDASEVLQPAEASLDDIAAPAHFLIMADFLLTAALAWDDGLDSALLEESADGVDVGAE